jgi:CubicO group peptidase (beta-lactamase class C family)
VGWSSGGFCKPNEEFDFGSDSAYGFYGTGGSFAFADPEHEIGYAYFMNKMDFYTQNDPREVALREAMYRVIARK